MPILIPLALLDLLATSMMLLHHFDFVGSRLVLACSIYLLAKGIAFRDPASFLDMAVGCYMIGMVFFGLKTFLVYVFAVYLVQKSLLSMKAFS